MLLRTASTPILNSLTPNSSTLSSSSSSSSFSSLSSLFSDQIKSITLTTTSYCTTNSATRNMFRTSSESDLRRPNHHSFGSGRRMMTNSDLGLREKVVENGFGSSDGGGCGGSDGGPLFWNTNYNYNNSNNINDNYNYNNDNHSKKIDISINDDDVDDDDDDDKNGVDVYYVKMIEANPGNSLLLGNYAKFLKEVQGDYMKAEEYCGRAILANPGDPNMLALYADLIWQTQRDSSKAETYFDQAVKAAPDDCYVLGSYAHFLWDAEDEDEEYDMKPSNNGVLPMTFHGISPSPPPLAAAS